MTKYGILLFDLDGTLTDRAEHDRAGAIYIAENVWGYLETCIISK